MTIFHDKLGNRLAMTETDALALGYTYKHKGLKMSEKVNQECSSTKANELADWFDGRILYLWDAEDGQYYDSAIADEIVPMLRQQQVDLKIADDYSYILERKLKEAQAEIEALKDKLMLAKQSLEIIEGWTNK